MLFGFFNIQVLSHLNYDELKYISLFSEFTPVQIYKRILNNESVINNLRFSELLNISDNLTQKNIKFIVSPEIPVLEKFDECFEDAIYVNKYKALIENLYMK